MSGIDRRAFARLGAGIALAAGFTATARASARPAPERNAGPVPEPGVLPRGAATLGALAARLAQTPRQRAFTTVPMILDAPEQWDAAALDAVVHYAGGPKQCWDNTDIAGPWLNVMRNALNTQIYAFKHPDFLCVSVTHGSAQFALYDDFVWAKYRIGSTLLGGKPDRNPAIDLPEGAAHDPLDYQDTKGAFSAAGNSITQLQRRGAVFLACHNAIWEHCERLMALGINPDGLSLERMAAEITNHLIPGVVLTPGAVGTLVELENAGFAYAR